MKRKPTEYTVLEKRTPVIHKPLKDPIVSTMKITTTITTTKRKKKSNKTLQT